MIALTNCKINLGLSIIGKLANGYHALETVFYPVPWYDGLEILDAATFQYTNLGIPIPGPAEDNVCIRAYRALQQDFDLPPVHLIHTKRLPMGAGLGGGSANAVGVLKLCSSQFDLNLSNDQLVSYANKLGSDCAFFVENRPALGSGTGQDLKPIALDLSAYYIALIYPGFGVSTVEAYAGITPKIAAYALSDLASLPLPQWRSVVANDFEKTIFERHPILPSIKKKLYHSGAIYAAMSGSGSAIFGLFQKKPTASVLQGHSGFIGSLSQA